MVQGQGIPIFYQRKAPSFCRVVVEEEVDLKAGTEVVLYGNLEPGFERNEMLERTAEVNYRIKRPQDPVSCYKVVHFDNLKLCQRRKPEMDVSRRN